MEDKDKQFNINVKAPEAGMVTEMMLSDGILNRSEFFRRLIHREWNHRQAVKVAHTEYIHREGLE